MGPQEALMKGNRTVGKISGHLWLSEREDWGVRCSYAWGYQRKVSGWEQEVIVKI